MYPGRVVKRVAELTRDGYSQKEIHSRTGVSPGMQKAWKRMGRLERYLSMRFEVPLEEGATLLVEALEGRYWGWEGAKQFGATPGRLVRMYEEFCWPPAKVQEEIEKQFRSFEQVYDEMLVVRPIDVWTLCPHHLLPCHFEVTIGYIPDGKVLGLSKFARIADVLGRRPIMQEQYSTELAELLMVKLEPKGVAVHIMGHHGCMTARGVKQHSKVVTSTIRGVFESQPETRAEFFAICRS